MTDCGAEIVANDLMTALIAGTDFPLPDIDLSDTDYALPDGSTAIDPPTALTNTALTQSAVGGAGTFDVIMTSLRAHLQAEKEAGRITGSEYTKAYIELTQVALGNAVQFLLSKDTAYYQAIAAQMAAKQAEVALVTSRVQLATAKAQLSAIIYEANNNKANYALTKMRLATEEIGYCTAKFQLDSILPQQALLAAKEVDKAAKDLLQADKQLEIAGKQSLLLDEQITMASEQAETARAQTMDTRTDGITPIAGVVGSDKAYKDAQITLANEQIEIAQQQLVLTREQAETARAQTLNTRSDGTPVTGVVGTQRDVAAEQIKLVREQAETARAQTMDTRIDGVTPIVGVAGKQRDLYAQQITSYKRDGEVKAMKLFVDAWITQKTIDEGLLAPDAFTNASLNAMLEDIKTNNALG